MGSWKLGRAFGIGIYVHWTFLLLLAFVTLTGWGVQPGAGPLYAALLLVLLFTCVVLHELGHALMARRFGVGTRDITLYPIGGVARLERMPENPWQEFLIAIAGPAVNVAIAALLFIPFALAGATADGLAGELVQLGRTDLVVELLRINIGLVIFNMLPAFPMDGGRVLRALLALVLSRLDATRIAATLGAVFAFLFVFAGLFWPGGPHYMLVFLAFFLFMAGQQELAMVRWQASRGRNGMPFLPVTGDVLDVEPVPVETAFNGAVWDQNHRVWVLWQDGRPVRTYWMPGSQG
jgi:Zn-dependent protease